VPQGESPTRRIITSSTGTVAIERRKIFSWLGMRGPSTLTQAAMAEKPSTASTMQVRPESRSRAAGASGAAAAEVAAASEPAGTSSVTAPC
jgi:hypothetical protein